MNVTFLNRLVGLTLVMVCACNAHAGLLEETYSIVYKKLSSGPYESLTKSTQSFTYDRKHYQGCVIRLSGNAKRVTDTQRPDGLLGHSLPYCPDGNLPADLPRGLFNEDGWCADRMADGPDGTSYRVLKENVFCAVEGHWDGGDDSDPKYVPSSRYEVIVRCAIR
jgi:hypothetical protein